MEVKNIMAEGVTFKSMFITILLLSVFAIGIFTVKTSLGTNYGVTTDSVTLAAEQNFTTLLENTSSLINTDLSSRTESSGGLNIIDTAFIISKDIYSIIKLPFKLIGIVKVMINNVGSALMIPDYVITALLSIFLITISFIVISAVLRKDT